MVSVRSRFILGFIFASCFAGCSGAVVTSQPLSKPFIIEPDQRLVGIWRASDQQLGEVDGLLHIEFRADGKFDAVAVSHNAAKGLTVERAEFVSAKLGSDSFLSLRHFAKSRKTSVSDGGYLLLKYAIQGDTIELSHLSPSYIQELIKKKKLKGRISRNGAAASVTLTDSFKKLGEVLQTADQTELYERVNGFTRVSGKSPVEEKPVE